MLQTLKLRKFPITVHVAETDELMPTAKQREVADILQVDVMVFHEWGAKQKRVSSLMVCCVTCDELINCFGFLRCPWSDTDSNLLINKIIEAC